MFLDEVKMKVREIETNLNKAADDKDVFEDIGLIGTLKKTTAYWSSYGKEFHTYNGETMFSLYPIEEDSKRSRFFKLSKSIQSLFKVE